MAITNNHPSCAHCMPAACLRTHEKIINDTQVNRLRSQQSQLKAEAAQLNKQAERLSSPASFAQSAKLTRKAVAKEKEAAALQTQEVLHSSFTVPFNICQGR